MTANEDPNDSLVDDKIDVKAEAAAPVETAPKPAPVVAKAEAAKPVVPAKAPKPAKTKAVVPPVVKVRRAAVAKPAEVVKPKAAPIPAMKAKAIKPKAVRPRAAAPKAAKTAMNTPFAGLFTNFTLEDKMMDMSPNFAGFQNAMTDAQAKAKAAFEKSTSMLGDAGEFAKGNVEAVIESGKILAEGLQGMGSELVTEGRTAFEAISGDIKDLAASKSPADFFKAQSDLMRKNFDSAVAYGSKNSEAMLKLMSDVMAPISGRVSVAMEKARSTSL